MDVDLNLMDKKGVVEIESNSTDNELISIASAVGDIVEHPNGQTVFTLTPKTSKNTVKGTFSNRFGFNEFPIHTDTAFLPKPVRYVLFHTVGKSTCDTTLVNINQILDCLTSKELSLLERAVFVVKTNQTSFYASLFFGNNSKEGFRYDPTCMSPTNKSAKKIEPILQNVLAKIVPYNITWSGNKTVIIDNWKSLHGRSAIGNDTERQLKRIYIN